MPNTLNKEDSILVIIDVQEKLVNMLEKDTVAQKTSTLAKAATIFEIPTVITEQYPKGLGYTIDLVKKIVAKDTQTVEKSTFSATKEELFIKLLKSYNKKQIIICGIEAHICVHQTTADLLSEGYEVYVAKDACASRNKYEFKQGVERMYDNGAKISCVEIILFEWLKTCKDNHFKEIQALIKIKKDMTMKTDKISFGTKPSIGFISTHAGLPKYKETLTEGICEAFQKLSKNNIDDELVLSFGLKPTSKNTYTEILELTYFEKNPNCKNSVLLKSVINLNPEKLEKLSQEKISEILLKGYKKLKTINKKSEAVALIPILKEKIEISNSHKKSLNNLFDKFGEDDFSLLI